jgi:hypothetical protein
MQGASRGRTQAADDRHSLPSPDTRTDEAFMLIAGLRPSGAYASWASWVSYVSTLFGGHGDREVPHRCVVVSLQHKCNTIVLDKQRTVE